METIFGRVEIVDDAGHPRCNAICGSVFGEGLTMTRKSASYKPEVAGSSRKQAHPVCPHDFAPFSGLTRRRRFSFR